MCAHTHTHTHHSYAAAAPKKKKKKPFISSSHTPPEHTSDSETKSTKSDSSHPQQDTPDTTVIPVPKPRTPSRTESPSDEPKSGHPVLSGSAPVKSGFMNERGPTPEPRVRSRTPSSQGSKNQSPISSGSDIAVCDTGSSGGPSPQKLPGVVKKPAPPPKPRPKPPKSMLVGESSVESYKSATLPLKETTTAGAPSKPAKQSNVFTDSESQRPSTLPRGVANTSVDGEPKVTPPKPMRRSFTGTNRVGSPPTSQEATVPESSTTPSKLDGGTGGTPPTSADSTTPVGGSSQEASSTTTTPSERPPPKPARSIRRKPVRDRVNHEEQTPSKVGAADSENSTSPKRESAEKAADEATTPQSDNVASGPPKPVKRVKSPQVMDSSSSHQLNQSRTERGTKLKTFDDGQSSIGTETAKPAVRTLNVSTPSPTSSSPTTASGGGGSFAEAAVMSHNVVSTTTAELSKTSSGRFESGSSSRAVKPAPMPKPRALQGAKANGNAPSKPVPPSKPSRSSVRSAVPDHN